MNDPFIAKQANAQRPKVTVQDKMDNRDCARLLDYYRMRVGNILFQKIRTKKENILNSNLTKNFITRKLRKRKD